MDGETVKLTEGLWLVSYPNPMRPVCTPDGKYAVFGCLDERVMKKCVENGLFGFTLCDDAYREAVCWWMKTQRHREIRPEWIVPVQGTIFSVATMIRMTVGPDDYMSFRRHCDRKLQRGN